MSRLLVILGLGLVLMGLLWPWLSKLPLGRLPGDLNIERPNGSVHFPVTTSILISVIATLLMYLFGGKK